MYYHGTTKDAATTIVQTQFMEPSIGDAHWLGNGCYFYENEEYAFRWILIKYTDNFRNKFSADYSGIYSKYSILSANIKIDSERVFSMENIHHRLLFIQVKTKLSEKTKESEKYREYLKNGAIVDGVVFNFLFNHEGYIEKYDAVRAVFPISYIYDDSRLEYLPEPQLCVKNAEVISSYTLYSKEEVPEAYKGFIISYNQVKKELIKKRKLDRYRKKPGSIKYKKEELT